MSGERGQNLPSALAELQRRVIKAEATIEQKEEENAELKEQLKQFERRWIEYEKRMKSMEDMWQKQMASLQVCFQLIEILILVNNIVIDKVDLSDQTELLTSPFCFGLLEKIRSIPQPLHNQTPALSRLCQS